VRGRERGTVAELPFAAGAARGAGEVRGGLERTRERGRARDRDAAAWPVPVVRAQAHPAAGQLRGRPALLSFSEVDVRTGVFSRPGINARRTMTFHPSGRVYTEGRDGRLHPTGRYWRA